ncbi:MAG TPA: nucleotidyltransferase domain-containing protein [Candidatus Sulfotelmatobacter sp.]|nr:nucleotidyltransferase domain-containing protein [Candidatus Sulfotelmatobacter sp.]
MANRNLKLRDRDGIVTKEGLIFRVFGYSHPPDAYVCDAEYASEKIFVSKDTRAPRTGGNGIFYKFYDDEGWKFVSTKYPQYSIWHEMLEQKITGVHKPDIVEVRKPGTVLKILTGSLAKDELVDATQRSLKIMLERTGLSEHDFGVFGSMLHGFHHPKLSDIDLIVYGIDVNRRVRNILQMLYAEEQSGFRNEFETEKAMEGKRWRFKNFTVKEFLWHQRRKQIYGLFDDMRSGRTIKAEFEPVKAWNEIKSEYDSNKRIIRRDWVKVRARITQDAEGPFIPSVYGINPLDVLSGSRAGLEAKRVISYMEEFRLQAWKDEIVIVEGNLEEVISPEGRHYQIALTYCPRYYEQTLKLSDLCL